MYKRLILVAGSGRSGTSLFSGVLKALGCHVPQPEVGADDSNPRGFGEPQWVVDFHTRLLRSAVVQTSDARPSAWAQTAAVGRERNVQSELEAWLRNEFKHGDHVVIKDPRLLWFIPMWRRAGETVAAPCFVTLLRHPLEVIKSKQTHYGKQWNANARTAGWINTMLYAERATRGDRRAYVRYEDLLEDNMLAVSKVSEELDLAFIERATPPQMRLATKLVDPSLRRSLATWSSLEVDHRLVDLAEETYRIFERAAKEADPDDPTVKLDLDSLRERYVELYRFVESTAQFSIIAGNRGALAPGRGARANAAGLSTSDSVRKLMRKAKKKGKKTIHQLRSK